MKDLLRTLFAVLAFAVIFGFIFVFATSFFQKIFIETSAEYLPEGIGAFMGAFFAFLFLRLGDGLTKIYERQVKHYNAMVELEFVLNQNRQEIANNLFIIKNFENNIEESIRQKIVFENPQRMAPIHTRHDLILKLFGKDIINKVFAYFVRIDTINVDIQSTERFYQTVVDRAFVEKNPQIYIYNIPELKNHFFVLSKFLTALIQESGDVLARVRVCLRKKPFFTRILFFILQGYGKVKEEDVAREKVKMQADFEEIKRKSKEENDRILYKS